jgi:CubicO group peptidase (beta-lactamase class C family)
MPDDANLARRVPYARDPSEVGFDPARLAAVERLVEAAVGEGVFPGAALVVARDGRTALARPFGRLTYAPDSPPVTLGTRYDLASLTKVIVTTTLSMQLVEAGALDLDGRVSAYLPDFAVDGPEKATITVRDLLAHCSGMPPTFPGHFPAYSTATGLARDRGQIVAAAIRTSLDPPPRTRVAYSDLGAIVLGAAIERVAGSRLDRLADERILGPLGLTSTGYNPAPGDWPRIAPTEDDPWRGRIVQGEVHDECAWAMGGVSAHAGLFGNAPDLTVFGQTLLDGGASAGSRIVREETIARFTTRDLRVPGSDRALGWQMASSDNSAGPDLSPESFGHTGFTGTSLWIDPARRLVVVLLSNRVHPRRENTRIIEFRPVLHTAIARSMHR